MEMSFKRGLVVRLKKTAEARKRIVEALTSKQTDTFRRAREVIAEYRVMAEAFYAGENEAKERVRSWSEELKDALRAELHYQLQRNDELANLLDKLVDSGAD